MEAASLGAASMLVSAAMATEKAIFGAGCFWGVEARFAALPGVLDTAAGYAGGHAEAPTYDQVCSGRTGHAEVVEVTYNPVKISYSDLLDAFFAMHNPAQPYRAAVGLRVRSARSDPEDTRDAKWDQYRSVIFTHTTVQAREADERVALLSSSGKYPTGVATEVSPAPPFWRAEERHQQYFAKRNIQA